MSNKRYTDEFKQERRGEQVGRWRRFSAAHGLEVSKRRRGNCWDNSVA